MTDPPIMLEPGLRYAGCGTNDSGEMWIKFINAGASRVRAVVIYITASKFRYNYAIADRATNTVVGYEGEHGDPARDESYVWGTRDPD